MSGGARALALGVVLVMPLGLAACGDPQVHASFSSRVVQHEICRVVGDRPEVCTREERTDDLRVRLVEQATDNVWLYGIVRGGVADRAVLGSYDEEVDLLFIDEAVHESDASTCTVTDRIEISLEIPADADPSAIGVDPCVPLVGRETEVTTSSAGCDTVNDPQLAESLIARRRWEPVPECVP